MLKTSTSFFLLPPSEQCSTLRQTQIKLYLIETLSSGDNSKSKKLQKCNFGKLQAIFETCLNLVGKYQ